MADNAPDTSQATSVGDAVLTFLGDTTNLETAFDRVATKAEQTMAVAAESVDKASTSFDGFNDVIDQSFEQWDGLTPRIVNAGKAAKDAGELSSKAMREAKGEVGLLGEMFGIHLPRHVRSFVAELPGVGAALSGAFAATAVLFLIEAMGKGVDKIKEWMEESHKMTMAWDEFNTAVAGSFRGLDDKLLEAGIKMDELKGDHVDALKKELELIDHVSLKDLEAQFGILAKAADAMFTQLKSQWLGMVAGSEGAQHALDDFKAKYDLLLAQGKDKEANDLLAGTLKSAKDTQKAMLDANAAADKLQDTVVTGGTAMAPIMNRAVTYTERQVQAQDVLVRALQAQQEAQQKINELAKDNASIKRTEEGNRQAEVDAKKQKEILDQQLANIDKWKADQHAAYEAMAIDAGTWRAAEVQATQAARLAHEDYLEKVIAIYQRAGEAEKVREKQAELATLQTKDAAAAEESLAAAEDKHRAATLKIVEAYEKMAEANVEKDFLATQKAAEGLTKAEEELLKAQAKLAQDTLSQHYKDQEAAITRLAQIHLITEEQKNDRLAVLEQQQSAQAVAILNDQLAKEKAVLDAAQAKLTQAQGGNPLFSAAQLADLQKNLHAAETALAEAQAEKDKLHQVAISNPLFTAAELEDFKKKLADAQAAYDDAQAKMRAAQAQMKSANENPFFTPAQVLELQANLDKAKAAYISTQSQIVQEQEKFNKQSEAKDKSRYGKALLEAESFGRALLAEMLKQTHAQLAAAETEQQLAKARGQDTTAMHQKVEALKQLEQALEKEATGNKKVIAAELQLHQAQLLAVQAIRAEMLARGLDTTAIDKQIIALQKLVNEEKQEATQTRQTSTVIQQLKTTTEDAAKTMMTSFATATEAMIKGQESFGKAMAKSTEQMIAKMAQQWAEYYLARAIADMWDNPGAAAAEFAAAAALEVLSGALSGLAGGGGGGAAATTGMGPQPVQTTGGASQTAQGGGTTTVSVPKLAGGGLVTEPTKIVAGDSPTGGSADEAILPLSDTRAMNQIGQSIVRGILSGAMPQAQPMFSAQGSESEDPEFIEAQSSPSEDRGFVKDQSSSATPRAFAAGEASTASPREFDRTEASSSSGARDFAPSAPSPATQNDFARSAGSSPAGPRDFAPGESSPALQRDFEKTAASSSPESSFEKGDSTSGSGPRDFSFANASSEAAHAFEKPAAPSVSDTLGFTSSPGTPAGAREFSQQQPAADSEQPAFSSGTQTPGGPRSFERTSSTVGEVLGFTASSPAPSGTREFSQAQSADELAPSFSRTGGSESDRQTFERTASTIGDLLGFNFSAGGTHQAPDFSFVPSAGPRESFDAEAIAAQLGGLLSPSTRRAASDVSAPAAAQAAASSSSLDESTMHRIVAAVASQTAQGGDTNIHHHAPAINLKGNVSNDAKRLAKELNRQVKKGMVHLKSSDSFRKTPRSQ